MPERFERLVIMRTWLHDPGYRNADALRRWSRSWAARIPQATFDPVDAGHFLQESHDREVAGLILDRIAEAPRRA